MHLLVFEHITSWYCSHLLSSSKCALCSYCSHLFTGLLQPHQLHFVFHMPEVHWRGKQNAQVHLWCEGLRIFHTFLWWFFRRQVLVFKFTRMNFQHVPGLWNRGVLPLLLLSGKRFISNPFHSETLCSRANKRFSVFYYLGLFKSSFSPGRAGWSKCWCLHKSCQQVRLWHRSLPQVNSVVISLDLRFT